MARNRRPSKSAAKLYHDLAVAAHADRMVATYGTDALERSRAKHSDALFSVDFGGNADFWADVVAHLITRAGVC